MKDFNDVSPYLITRWCNIIKYHHTESEIVHIRDPFAVSSANARDLGFLEVVETYNDNQDRRYKLTEDGLAYVQFLLL